MRRKILFRHVKTKAIEKFLFDHDINKKALAKEIGISLRTFNKMLNNQIPNTYAFLEVIASKMNLIYFELLEDFVL